MQSKIKICGATKASDVWLLDEAGASYAGLWYGVPKGKHNLELEKIEELSNLPTKSLKFILVTMNHNIAQLREAVNAGNIAGIQFHGFQLPAFIQKVKKEFGDSLKIFKVLHIKNDQCLEEDLVARYLEAGTDIIILDSYQDKTNIGSTGLAIADGFLTDFLSRWKISEKVMIAGGIDEHSIGLINNQHKPYGIDIDSAARIDGEISRERLREIIR